MIVRWVLIALVVLATAVSRAAAQEAGQPAHKPGDLELTPATFRSADGTEVAGEVGRLWVPENRNVPGSRTISIAFVRLKSTNPDPRAPMVFLAGGPGDTAVAGLQNPGLVQSLLGYLKICDVISLDQRGTGQSEPSLVYRNPKADPARLFGTREEALAYIVEHSLEAAEHFRAQGVDCEGYTTEQSADDLNDLRIALKAERLSLLGFSYGTHLALSAIRRHGPHLENVVIVGVEGPDHTHKLPLDMDTQFRKVALLAALDPGVAKEVPDLVALLDRVLKKLDTEPMVVTIIDPRTRREVQVPVGRFGLQLILRMDIGDRSDLVVFPKLLHSIEQGDTSILKWFLQRRYAQFSGVNLMTWLMDGASGASPDRWAAIRAQAPQSMFGDCMVFPFPDLNAPLGISELPQSFRDPIVSEVRTLLLTGSLDWNTPPYQAEQIRWGFVNGTHITVENAGHEQILPLPQIQKAILAFLAGEDVDSVHAALPPLRFVPIEGSDPEVTHPSVGG